MGNHIFFLTTGIRAYGLLGFIYLCKSMEGNVGRMSSFNGSNWVTWKTKMEDLLFCKDLYGPIEGDCGKPDDMKDDEWKRLN